MKKFRCKSCNGLKMKGSELIFISSIKRDGSGVVNLSETDMKHENNTVFDINCLSMKNGTFIASQFNSYVVKLKD